MKDKLSVDALAQEIRRVDGNHSLGAGDLADALMPFITSILDAEGDGGAVAWLHEVIADDGIADLALSFEPDSFPFADVAGYQSIKHSPLYTHPARSGVVSDEDVEGAWMVLTGRAGSIAHEKDHECMMDIERKAVRAALEHFAAIAQEKQS